MNERVEFLAIDALIASLGLALAAGLFAVETIRQGGRNDGPGTSMPVRDAAGRSWQAAGAGVPIAFAVLVAAWLAWDARADSPLLTALAVVAVAGAFLAPLVFIGPLASPEPAYVAAFSVDIAVLGIVAWSAPSPLVATVLLPVALVSILFALGWRIGVPLAALALAACLAGLFFGGLLPSDQVTRDVAFSAGVAAALAVAVVASVDLGWRRHRRLIDRLTSDPVTALHTRAQLQLVLRQELMRSIRFGRPLSMLMIDLDGMKAVNDSLGHQAGDRYLRSVGQAIARNSRRTDFAARFGGDEFVVVLPETDRAGATVIAGVLQRRLGDVRITRGSRVLSGSASVGIATYPDDGATEAQLLAHADRTMYAEKLRRRRPPSRALAQPTQT